MQIILDIRYFPQIFEIATVLARTKTVPNRHANFTSIHTLLFLLQNKKQSKKIPSSTDKICTSIIKKYSLYNIFPWNKSVSLRENSISYYFPGFLLISRTFMTFNKTKNISKEDPQEVQQRIFSGEYFPRETVGVLEAEEHFMMVSILIWFSKNYSRPQKKSMLSIEHLDARSARIFNREYFPTETLAVLGREEQFMTVSTFIWFWERFSSIKKQYTLYRAPWGTVSEDIRCTIFSKGDSCCPWKRTSFYNSFHFYLASIKLFWTSRKSGYSE